MKEIVFPTSNILDDCNNMQYFAKKIVTLVENMSISFALPFGCQLNKTKILLSFSNKTKFCF